VRLRFLIRSSLEVGAVDSITESNGVNE